MKDKRIWLMVLLLGLGAAVFINSILAKQDAQPVIINQTAVPPVPTLDSEKVSRGEPLYAQYCASCHGVDLKGSPTWKEPLSDGSLPPPPHDSSGHTWHHTDDLLIGIIRNGEDPSYNSKMPAFKDKFTEDENMAVLEFIKSKWGREEREFQWWITARPE